VLPLVVVQYLRQPCLAPISSSIFIGDLCPNLRTR
jgi:hypothetical protein